MPSSSILPSAQTEKSDPLPTLAKGLGYYPATGGRPLTHAQLDAIRQAADLITPANIVQPFPKTAAIQGTWTRDLCSRQRIRQIVRRAARVNHVREPHASRCNAAANLLHDAFAHSLRNALGGRRLETAAREFANGVAVALNRPAPFKQPKPYRRRPITVGASISPVDLSPEAMARYWIVLLQHCETPAVGYPRIGNPAYQHLAMFVGAKGCEAAKECMERYARTITSETTPASLFSAVLNAGMHVCFQTENDRTYIEFWSVHDAIGYGNVIEDRAAFLGLLNRFAG